ncbi:hypothetical protein Hanom_Chr03g00212331 [Helianthus anomalus]
MNNKRSLRCQETENAVTLHNRNQRWVRNSRAESSLRPRTRTMSWKRYNNHS